MPTPFLKSKIMYKLKKEYIGQDVTIFMRSKSIKLDFASQDEFAEVYKIDGYKKYIDCSKKSEPKKVVKKVESKK